MSEREEMLEELVEECLERIDELESRLSEQESKFEAFAEPCAIGSEQLWKVVFNDILKRPVPNGIDLKPCKIIVDRYNNSTYRNE